MMSKAVTPSIGGYEKKDKNGNPTGKYTNAQAITPAPLTVKQRTK